MGGWWIDRVADMNMLKVYVPPSSINSSVGTTGLNNAQHSSGISHFIEV